jgi:hypothetical protein
MRENPRKRRQQGVLSNDRKEQRKYKSIRMNGLDHSCRKQIIERHRAPQIFAEPLFALLDRLRLACEYSPIVPCAGLTSCSCPNLA